jgi:predicted RNase H-like HicB family nuclease
MSDQERAKLVEQILSKPYTIEIVGPDSEGDWVARVVEWPGCITHDTTAQKALSNLLEVREDWVRCCLDGNTPIPEPRKENLDV